MSKDTLTTILGVVAAAGIGMQDKVSGGVIPPGTIPPDIQQIGGVVSVIAMALWGFFTNKNKPAPPVK